MPIYLLSDSLYKKSSLMFKKYYYKDIMRRVVLITGAGSGLGLATSVKLAKLGYHVIMTARSCSTKGQIACNRLLLNELSVDYRPLDVTNNEDRRAIVDYILEQYGRLDVLINNAAVMLDSSIKKPGTIARTDEITAEHLRHSIEVNALGPYDLIKRLSTLMRKQKYGRVVNVSTGLAQLSSMGAGWPSYRVSKTMLNAITRIFAAELHADNILVNSVSPGWARTNMGGTDAPLSAEEAVDSIVWASQLPDSGPTGAFVEKRKLIPW